MRQCQAEIDKDNLTNWNSGKGRVARHDLLKTLLMRLVVDEETAVEDACKMEHGISDRSFEAIKQYFQNNK